MHTHVRMQRLVILVSSKEGQTEYLVYVNWVVLRHQRLALFSISNNLTELKDSEKHKQGATYQFNISTRLSISALITQKHLNWLDLIANLYHDKELV